MRFIVIEDRELENGKTQLVVKVFGAFTALECLGVLDLAKRDLLNSLEHKTQAGDDDRPQQPGRRTSRPRWRRS